MKDITEQIVDFSQEPEFWSKISWLSFTNKYNDRLICLKDDTCPWNFAIINLTKGDELSKDNSYAEWSRTQPFFEKFMERVCLCLNYCRNKTNKELKEGAK